MEDFYPVVKAAAIQASPEYLDRDATVEKACSLIDRAGSEGAKLIAFPEAYIPGYPWWIWFDEPAAGIPFFMKLYKNAVTVPGPAVQKLSEAAKKNGVYVCISVTEKDGASLYLTQLWFNPNGDLIGKHRKLKPSGAERYIWGEGDASMMPVFDTEIGRLGGLECWEHMVPANMMAMMKKNEQIHVQSWPSCFPQPEHLFSNYPLETGAKAYSIINQVYSVISSQIYTEQMRDMLCTTEKQREIMQPGYGMTMIVDPAGHIISSVPRDEEGICYAELDLSLLIAGKFLTDPAGHYSNQSLRLIIDENPRPPVTIIGRAEEQTLSYEELQDISAGGNP
ncbi:carbon-nitrogen hydrolase family protein [Extibacter muris]|uniref:carbon-nitrogen hydrolase family protein n=1 Tax=Extibacter muris TaxID=1796622 RepID=UPI001D0664BF|nr:carbon-nitrogen hydrolase family protein [Extibacter muris]MCB6203144.1 carbon-nitrogen hydrolase family protein [Extibacter muris]MCQ4664245.1 carbon-nitrogen hydrolase family protein [Extibacter muris]MCQ4694044.1 carbon-nitrogen hydrolase family protein [Extibacter muris]